MEEVAKGIYLYRDELVRPAGRPIIGVHLWYKQFSHRFRLFPVNGADPRGDYFSNLSDFFKSSSSRNIFLFEERGFCGGIPVSVAKEISEIRGDTRGVYIVPTISGESRPVSRLWDGACGFVKNFSDSVDVAGGYTRINAKNEISGCVGGLLEEFGKRGIKSSLIEGCCFC